MSVLAAGSVRIRTAFLRQKERETERERGKEGEGDEVLRAVEILL